MPLFCITRPQFLDRIFDDSELAAMAEMLRQWYRLSAGVRPEEAGYWRCEAVAYSFSRHDADAIRERMTARMPGVSFDGSDPDSLARVRRSVLDAFRAGTMAESI